MENWKDIIGFEGKYQVSDHGRVKALRKTVRYKDGRAYTYEEKVLSQKSNPNGYQHLNLFISTGNAKSIDVHRAVAFAFIPNPESKREVNHINGNKADNRVDNLEWCTSKENKAHGFLTGLYKSENQGKGRIKRLRHASDK